MLCARPQSRSFFTVLLRHVSHLETKRLEKDRNFVCIASVLLGLLQNLGPVSRCHNSVGQKIANDVCSRLFLQPCKKG